MPKIFIVALLAPALFAAAPLKPGPAPAPGGELRVTAAGLKPGTGRLMAALFSSPDGFPGDHKKAVALAMTEVKGTSATVVMEGVPFGTYALSVYQDLNSDGKLNKSFFGVPREPVGFSTNPELGRGAPPFSKASFVFDRSGSELPILMKTY